jgi:selenide,water dikinase
MADLAYVLRQLPSNDDPNLLVGSNPADDAAIYRLRDDLALIQTVDFFTPIVDDPYVFGQIAAANSLSDVYAMGGSPITALNIVGFPVSTLGDDVLAAILRGGAEKALEAGVSIVGGHTVDDPEPKYGLAVTGTVHPDRYMTAHTARPGDVLVLTKPIGTGVVATALKAGAGLESHQQQAVRWMTRLNRAASECMMSVDTHAATDITGYGLLGHLVEMCRASGVAATLHAGRMPLLPGALGYVRLGFVPGGSRSNLQYVSKNVSFDNRVDDAVRLLLADAQTSGGLLLSLSREAANDLRCRAPDEMLTAIIGDVIEGEAGSVKVSE